MISLTIIFAVFLFAVRRLLATKWWSECGPKFLRILVSMNVSSKLFSRTPLSTRTFWFCPSLSYQHLRVDMFRLQTVMKTDSPIRPSWCIEFTPTLIIYYFIKSSGSYFIQQILWVSEIDNQLIFIPISNHYIVMLYHKLAYFRQTKRRLTDRDGKFDREDYF